ncbi:MAG TPA: GNAT family N-acetyltransferase [Cellvibrio sp.]|nr:GNAT family N-acetyltransferase [Cellvibrio sp.]
MSEFFPASNHPGFFSTHQWINAWQDAWADCDDILAVQRHIDLEVSRNGFYKYTSTRFGVLKISTLFPAGISTRASPSLRSEYFNLVGQSAAEFINAACAHSWDQLYVPDLILASDVYRKLCAAAQAKQLNVVCHDSSTTYAVRLQENSFSNYLASVGSNTRLKLFNKRKKLYQAGAVEVRNLWPNLDEFIGILNQFHQQRWGKPCYQGRNLSQINSFLQQISLVGGRPDLSVIYSNGNAISAVLDLKYCDRIYNIQSGYLEKFQDGISLGTLHFGFQLEKAFASGASHYDFMAGNGKNSNYKKSLATHSETFVSLMFVRSPLLKGLYATKKLVDSFRSQS